MQGHARAGHLPVCDNYSLMFWQEFLPLPLIFPCHGAEEVLAPCYLCGSYHSLFLLQIEENDEDEDDEDVDDEDEDVVGRKKGKGKGKWKGRGKGERCGFR